MSGVLEIDVEDMLRRVTDPEILSAPKDWWGD